MGTLGTTRFRLVNVAALMALGLATQGCSEDLSPEDVTHEPAVMYLNEASDTVTTARIHAQDGAWLVQWEPAIACDTAVGNGPVGSMFLYVLLPVDVRTGDVFDIVARSRTELEDAEVTVLVREDGSSGGYAFNEGLVVVDAWGPEGATIRVHASVGYAGIEGAIQATTCPE